MNTTPGADARGPEAYARERRGAGAGPVYIAVVAGTLPFYLALPEQTASLLYDAVAVSAAAAMLAGVVLYRPEPRAAWLLLALAVVSWAVGDIVYGTAQPVPSVSDVFYLSGYPLLGIGIAGLRRRGGGEGRRPAMVDAVMTAGGVAVLATVLLMVPAGHTSGVGPAGVAVAVSYPVMDAALIVMLIQPLGAAGRARPALALLLAGSAVHLAADIGFAAEGFGSDYGVGSVVDLGFLLSYALLGASLLHPGIAAHASGHLRPRRVEATVEAGSKGPVIVAARTRTGVRFRRILAISGLILVCLGVGALMVGGLWRAPDVMVLSAAYGTMGSFMLLARSTGAA